jgi:hypothetical protein
LTLYLNNKFQVLLITSQKLLGKKSRLPNSPYSPQFSSRHIKPFGELNNNFLSSIYSFHKYLWKLCSKASTLKSLERNHTLSPVVHCGDGGEDKIVMIQMVLKENQNFCIYSDFKCVKFYIISASKPLNYTSPTDTTFQRSLSTQHCHL